MSTCVSGDRQLSDEEILSIRTRLQKGVEGAEHVLAFAKQRLHEFELKHDLLPPES
jgi:hypothetical protein